MSDDDVLPSFLIDESRVAERLRLDVAEAATRAFLCGGDGDRSFEEVDAKWRAFGRRDEAISVSLPLDREEEVGRFVDDLNARSSEAIVGTVTRCTESLLLISFVSREGKRPRRFGDVPYQSDSHMLLGVDGRFFRFESLRKKLA